MHTLRRRTLNLSSLSDLHLTCGRSFLRLLQGDKRKFLDQAASRDLATPPDSADRLGQGQAFMPYPCPTFHRWIMIQRFFLILFKKSYFTGCAFQSELYAVGKLIMIFGLSNRQNKHSEWSLEKSKSQDTMEYGV